MIGRRRKSDPVTAELRLDVIDRDIRLAGGCVAAFLDPEHGCRNAWGAPHPPTAFLTLDHVQTDYGRMGKRAPSRRENLASLCYNAHLNGWATANRPLLREYLHEQAARPVSVRTLSVLASRNAGPCAPGLLRQQVHPPNMACALGMALLADGYTGPWDGRTADAVATARWGRDTASWVARMNDEYGWRWDKIASALEAEDAG